MYLMDVGWLGLPSGQSLMYELPSKSRAPFCAWLAWHSLTGLVNVRFCCVGGLPGKNSATGRGPAGTHVASDPSQLLTPCPTFCGHGSSPSVVAPGHADTME